MDIGAVAITLLAGAGVGSLVSWAGQFYFRNQDERKRAIILARQAGLMAASLEVMFYFVEEKSQTEFDARRLPALMAFIQSPEFLAVVKPEDLVSAYSALSILEVQHLQYERIYPRFVDLHARAILGHLIEPEDKELERIEAALRQYAKDAREALKNEIRPALSRTVQRLARDKARREIVP